MPGDLEGSGGDSNLGAAGDIGSSEKGGLVALEDTPGVGVGARVDPTSGQGRGESGALGDPLGDTG